MVYTEEITLTQESFDKLQKDLVFIKGQIQYFTDVLEGMISSKNLHDDSVTTDKIVAGAITALKIETGTITTELLEAGAISLATAASDFNWSTLVDDGNKPNDNADVTLSAIQGELSLTGGGLVLASAGAKIRGGQTSYGVGTGFWLGDDSGVSKFSIGSPTAYLKWDGSAIQIKSASALSNINVDLGTITAGNITLDSSGFIRSFGKDNYADTTAGYWLGYDTDAYKLNIGDETHCIKWDGTKLIIGDTLGTSNIALGRLVLQDNISGQYNVGIGRFALNKLTASHFNVAIGDSSLMSLTTGTGENVAIGYQASYESTTAHSNVAIGCGAGKENETGYLNVFIGMFAGYNEMGSKKLYIDVSNTTTPLIYGDFDSEFIEIHGNLGIGTRVFGTSATRTLAMLNGTIPSTSPANAIQLYAEDVGGNSELKVRDEGTTVTTLSPHNFELFKPNKDDPFPWSYHSINQLIGKKVNADIGGALRELEVLTGKKFLYYENVDKLSLSEYMEDKKEQLIALYIAENGSEVEVEKAEAWGEVEVEVQDIKEITGYDTSYEFDEKTGKVKEIKKPKYGKKTILKNKLKSGYRFNEETGKFLKKIKSTEVEAEKAIKKELVIPKWIEDRL